MVSVTDLEFQQWLLQGCAERGVEVLKMACLSG